MAKLYDEPKHGDRGVTIRNQPPTHAYRDGWERTFKKQKPRPRKPTKRRRGG